MLARLIYASALTAPLGPEALTTLLRKARVRNALRGVTGLLTFDSKYFLQVIEGTPPAVNDLYARIVTDPRHRNVTLLKYASIESRGFPDWQMGFLSANAAHRALYARLMTGAHFDPFVLDGEQAEGLLVELSRAGARNGEVETA